MDALEDQVRNVVRRHGDSIIANAPPIRRVPLAVDIDADGHLWIVDRLKELIKYKGFQVPPAELEAILITHPAVADCAVVGLPDPRLQERACACVVLRPGVDGFSFEEMKAFLAEKGLAKQYWPERLEVLPTLPTTASGKVQKYRLRDAIAGAS